MMIEGLVAVGLIAAYLLKENMCRPKAKSGVYIDTPCSQSACADAEPSCSDEQQCSGAGEEECAGGEQSCSETESAEACSGECSQEAQA